MNHGYPRLASAYQPTPCFNSWPQVHSTSISPPHLHLTASKWPTPPHQLHVAHCTSIPSPDPLHIPFSPSSHHLYLTDSISAPLPPDRLHLIFSTSHHIQPTSQPSSHYCPVDLTTSTLNTQSSDHSFSLAVAHTSVSDTSIYEQKTDQENKHKARDVCLGYAA